MFHPLLAAIWQLIRDPGLVEAGESVCKYSLCLSWKPLKTHLAFALEEIALLVRLDGEHPSSSHKISRLDLPHIDEIKNLIVNPRSVPKRFCFTKLLVVSSYFLS